MSIKPQRCTDYLFKHMFRSHIVISPLALQSVGPKAQGWANSISSEKRLVQTSCGLLVMQRQGV